MRTRLLCVATLVAASLATPVEVGASIFDIHLTARVVHVGDLTGTLAPFVQVGDRVDIWVGYIPETSEQPFYEDDPTRASYLSLGWFKVTINDLVFWFDNVNLDVIDSPSGDQFLINAGTGWTGTALAFEGWPSVLPLFPNMGGGVGFIDMTAPFELLTSDAIPTLPLRHLHPGDFAAGHVGAGTDDLSMYSIDFEVPEPTSFALIGLGLAWTMARGRRY